ncbi:RHS repeat-associated core domain-containing protein [Pseudomonas monteilii]|uniref:RHS repeat-associated core domain-containing protein n=1 Tax=Pseudomonas monteilii TaxID=76759 RepID=A0A399M8T9_9PSED|nr:RHS repeat-associated core domain-containing protein [Pseudomonas monteilii]RII77805.1 RHS repeat-associated core domain-containing protein [Pseudomonas monteilii]
MGFTGVFYDAALKTYSLGNGHRVYSPSLMRFLQPDGFSPFREGGLNCCAYCEDDPINFTDPTGRFKGQRRPTAQSRTNGIPQTGFRASQGFNAERPPRVVRRAQQREEQRAQQHPQGRQQGGNHAQRGEVRQEMNLPQGAQLIGQEVPAQLAINLAAIRTQQIHPVEVVLGIMTIAISGASVGEAFTAWMTTGAVRNPMEVTRHIADYSPGYSPYRPPVG